MKFLFIVQGEGRGHLTQAISLREILLRNGHEVVAVLVGKNKRRELPDFFLKGISSPVIRFDSPNFLPSSRGKKPSLGKSVIFNFLKAPFYFRSTFFIRKQIKKSKADVVINFYELLAGVTYSIFSLKTPYVCIAHQYILLHPEFKFPKENLIELYLLRFFTKKTCTNASKLLALSFREMKNSEDERIVVVPPLLRKEVFEIQPQDGDYLHGYMLDDTYADEIIRYQSENPGVKIRFFWDRKNVSETEVVNECLSFHKLNDKLFLEYMANSLGYATTAGFESVCEAMYFNKPILMVPTHIEQICNAFDASISGAGIVSDDFDLSKLINYIPYHSPQEDFCQWVRLAEKYILKELETVS